jgi:hypothetical protein
VASDLGLGASSAGAAQIAQTVPPVRRAA